MTNAPARGSREMQVKQLIFLNQFSGDPPGGGSPARGALHEVIVWSTIAPARGSPEIEVKQ